MSHNGRERCVRHIGHGISHSQSDIGHICIDQLGRSAESRNRKCQDRKYDQKRRAGKYIRSETSPSRVGSFHDGPHHRIIDTIPDLGDQHQHGYSPYPEAKYIRIENGEICTYHGPGQLGSNIPHSVHKVIFKGQRFHTIFVYFCFIHSALLTLLSLK